MSRSIVRALVAALAVQFGASASAADLIVSAASSLTNAFADVGHAFEAAHPGTKVLLNFGGSGQLLQQIAKGAPADVFASADQETMDKAESENLIEPGTRADFVRNALVVIVPADSKLSLASLDQLKKNEFKHIAVGNPDSVPVGRYSKAVLTASGHWDALLPKVVNTQNVRQSLDYVARGEVDAAFVYRTDAAILPDKVKVALEVPTVKAILYPVAVVKGSDNKDVAKEFVRFVRSDAAQKILQKYAFGQP
ncbi:MAG: molybdate ABC transporter substrate-binding protein [Betaproteobacteria bacterium]